MPFRNMSTDEMRNLVRHQLETLERWLRRLIDDALNAHFGGSLAALPIKQDIKNQVADRRSRDPSRYPREVDALLFDDLVTILCHPQLFGPHFQGSLKDAFPDGAAEARTFLSRIAEARNPLAHANDVTSHQALRVACYSTDVIDSLKAYYASINMAQTYDAPSFIRVWDGFGNNREITESDGCRFHFDETQLRPGDILELEALPDESYPEDSYEAGWIVCNVAQGERCKGRKLSLVIKNHHVSKDGLMIRAVLTSKKDWHRHGNYDAMFHVSYPVLPPV